MRKAAVFLLLAGLGIFLWLAAKLSSDAVGMLLGIVFGVLACAPAILLAGYFNQASEHYEDGVRAGRAQMREELRQAQLQQAQRLAVKQEWIDSETWIALETRRP